MKKKTISEISITATYSVVLIILILILKLWTKYGKGISWVEVFLAPLIAMTFTHLVLLILKPKNKDSAGDKAVDKR